jgi:hypothetical protein
MRNENKRLFCATTAGEETFCHCRSHLMPFRYGEQRERLVAAAHVRQIHAARYMVCRSEPFTRMERTRYQAVMPAEWCRRLRDFLGVWRQARMGGDEGCWKDWLPHQQPVANAPWPLGK